MSRTRMYIKAASILIVMLFGGGVAAQDFARVSVRPLCAGSSGQLTFGFSQANDAVISGMVASLNHAEKVFLPDGVPCGDNGCSYRSPLTFTDFAPGAVISSVNDIRFVRLNMEHSYIGDIYINITCPNGSKADIMRYAGSGTSSCDDVIPMSSKMWLAGSNISQGNFFGEAYDNTNSSMPCDSTATGNEPGIGWNYCWSDNTEMGYTYGAGDGRIYRQGNAHGQKVDSSDVGTGTQFYHPDDNFAALVGCPLNGAWYIEVVDGFSQDNGYIFDWELSLDPDLLPDSCALTARGVEVVGDAAGAVSLTAVNDSVYDVAAAVIATDTTIDVRFWMVNSCGDTIDTVVGMDIMTAIATSDSVEAEEEYVLGGVTYTRDTVLTFNGVAANGCDSVHTRHVTVTHIVYVSYDTVVCDPVYPIEWHGYSFAASGMGHRMVDMEHGVDSSITITLNEAWSTDTTLAAAVCDGQDYRLGDTVLATEGTYSHTFATWMGCDSVVTVELTVHPTYDSLTVDTACVTTGYTFEGQQLDASGTYAYTYPTLFGCDSTMRLRLAVVGGGLKAEAKVMPEIVTADNPMLTLIDVSQGATARLWLFDGMQRTEPSLQTLYPVELDSMEVQLIAYSSVYCMDTATVVVRIDRTALAAPNAFMPDHESNNRWRIEQVDVEEMHVWIYNRQGSLVATLEGPDDAWDGTCNGEPCPQGAYIYHARYTSRIYPERNYTLKGTILLIR